MWLLLSASFLLFAAQISVLPVLGNVSNSIAILGGCKPKPLVLSRSGITNQFAIDIPAGAPPVLFFSIIRTIKNRKGKTVGLSGAVTGCIGILESEFQNKRAPRCRKYTYLQHNRQYHYRRHKYKNRKHHLYHCPCLSYYQLNYPLKHGVTRIRNKISRIKWHMDSHISGSHILSIVFCAAFNNRGREGAGGRYWIVKLTGGID